jgi:type IV pilus assembly protein PilA
MEITEKFETDGPAESAQGLLVVGRLPVRLRPMLPSSAPRPLGRHRRSAERGFSLIELIVVVIIIAVLAVVAIPAVTTRLRDRRTEEAAQEVANIYRDARMRAMGRGAAVLVSYDDTTVPTGELTVQEAVRGTAATDPNCQRLPVSSCTLTTWTLPGGTGQTDVTDNILLSTFNPSIRGEYANVQIQMFGPSDTPGQQQHVDVCFTPLGGTYVRYGGTTFAPLAGIPTLEVWRKATDGTAEGLVRTVMLVPNGNAWLGTSKGTP